MTKRDSRKRIVLAYAGGLDTTRAIPRLARERDAEIVTVTVDVGQRDDLADVRERALAAGALRAHVIDARDEMIRDYVVPSLQAEALAAGRYPLGRAMARALVARRMVEMARMEGAAVIAHGCEGREDSSLLDVPVRALNGTIEVLAACPPRHEAHRRDANLWGQSILVSASAARARMATDEIFRLTRTPLEAPDEPACVDIEFDAGVPVRVNGIDMPLIEMIESLETIAGSHGVGRLERLTGSSGLEIHEAPAAVVLHAAHQALEADVHGPDRARSKRELSRAYADLIDAGRWFDPARRDLDGVVADFQAHVTGSVRLKLFKGGLRVVHRRLSAIMDEDARGVRL
jgi:argininosuccinate synthase